MTDQPTSYPPFSGDDARCPKCTGALGKMYHPRHTRPWFEFGWTDHRFDNNSPEWMLRTCADCGYRRAEMCADAEAGL